jgi:hypothetical protein
MLERSESTLHFPVPAPRVVEVIVDFAAYPHWAHGVREARVLSTEGDGWPDRVRFDVTAGIIRDRYVLDYDWQLDVAGTGTVSWELVHGATLRSLRGSYALDADRSGTTVTHRLSMQPAVPMLRALRRKTEQLIITSALGGLHRRVLALEPVVAEGEMA